MLKVQNKALQKIKNVYTLHHTNKNKRGEKRKTMKEKAMLTDTFDRIVGLAVNIPEMLRSEKGEKMGLLAMIAETVNSIESGGISFTNKESELVLLGLMSIALNRIEDVKDFKKKLGVTKLNGNTCPVCGALIDGVRASDDTIDPPKEGDVSVCYGCTSYLVFDENLRSKEMSVEALFELPDEARLSLNRMRLDIRRSKRKYA